MNRKDFFSLVIGGTVGTVAASSFLSGCSGLLDQSNPNTLTPDNFWKNSDQAKSGLTAVYQSFLGQNGWAASYNWYDRMVPALYRADDIGINHDVPAWWSLALNTYNSSNTRVENLWAHTYIGIYRANQVINNVPDISMDSSLKKRIIGQAKFLRAYFYFTLLINYRNIPIILEAPKASKHYSVAQSSPEDSWHRIEEDFKDAMNALPDSYNADNLGRITKGAAMGYLGKSYLYQEKWSNAATVFNQIITNQTYDLVPKYKNVFPASNDFSEESLLEINFRTTAKGQNLWSPRNREEGLSEGGGWYECYPNQWLIDQMMKEKTTSGELDPRIFYTVLWNDSGMKYYGQTYENLVGANGTKTGWMKYSQADLDHTISQYSPRNCRVLRFSDVLLMHAEAVIKSNGTLPDARNSINRVRNRANLGNLPSGMTQNEVLQEIEHQRVCELADEGIRWYDLVRWGGSIDGSMTIKQNLQQHGAIGAKNFEDYKKWLPIPLSEINTNTKIKQNPGY